MTAQLNCSGIATRLKRTGIPSLWALSELAGLTVCLLATVQAVSQARAQVAVGYSGTINASMSRVQQNSLNLRDRSSFGIGGSNVEPIDGGNIYDARTIWRIRDPSQPSSLILVQETSVFDAQQDTSDTRQQQSARREAVTVTLLPPLDGVLVPQSVSPFAPVVPVLPSPLSTSVFP